MEKFIRVQKWRKALDCNDSRLLMGEKLAVFSVSFFDVVVSVDTACASLTSKTIGSYAQSRTD